MSVPEDTLQDGVQTTCRWRLETSEAEPLGLAEANANRRQNSCGTTPPLKSPTHGRSPCAEIDGERSRDGLVFLMCLYFLLSGFARFSAVSGWNGERVKWWWVFRYHFFFFTTLLFRTPPVAQSISLVKQSVFNENMVPKILFLCSPTPDGGAECFGKFAGKIIRFLVR